jgi:hypothetical protein
LKHTQVLEHERLVDLLLKELHTDGNNDLVLIWGETGSRVGQSSHSRAEGRQQKTNLRRQLQYFGLDPSKEAIEREQEGSQRFPTCHGKRHGLLRLKPLMKLGKVLLIEVFKLLDELRQIGPEKSYTVNRDGSATALIEKRRTRSRDPGSSSS